MLLDQAWPAKAVAAEAGQACRTLVIISDDEDTP